SKQSPSSFQFDGIGVAVCLRERGEHQMKNLGTKISSAILTLAFIFGVSVAAEMTAQAQYRGDRDAQRQDRRSDNDDRWNDNQSQNRDWRRDRDRDRRDDRWRRNDRNNGNYGRYGNNGGYGNYGTDRKS